MMRDLDRSFLGNDCVTIHYKDDHFLALSRDSLEFHVDGRTGKFDNANGRNILLYIIERSPRVATPDDLRLNVGQCNYAKYISIARKSFERAGLHLEVIENMRNTGYRLAPGWELHDLHRSVIGDALSQVERVVELTRMHVQSSQLSESKMGMKFVERSPVTVSQSHQAFVLLMDAGWQLIHELGRLDLGEEHAPDIIEVKVHVERLISYATFMRIGHRLSPEDWRKDFFAEMLSVHARLKQDVGRLYDASRRKKGGGTR